MKEVRMPSKGSLDLRDFFFKYLELVNPFLKLRQKERKVLAYFMYFNTVLSKKYVDKEDPAKWRELFSPEIKSQICENLQLSPSNLANNITVLRKKKYIIGGKEAKNMLHPILRMYPTQETHKLTFEFHINYGE